jgi:hypothetical protein
LVELGAPMIVASGTLDVRNDRFFHIRPAKIGDCSVSFCNQLDNGEVNEILKCPVAQVVTEQIHVMSQRKVGKNRRCHAICLCTLAYVQFLKVGLYSLLPNKYNEVVRAIVIAGPCGQRK